VEIKGYLHYRDFNRILQNVTDDLPDSILSKYMKVREIIHLIEKDGWYLVRTKGDHRQFKHITKTGLVTISGNSGRDMPPGTLNSVLKQSGLKGTIK
jgi:predicted RNA binding protein YcfA (HicA-like mRNA interferase family)